MKMKQIYLPFIAALLCTNLFAQQPVVDQTITPEDAVQLLLGSGVEAFNITFSGDLDQIGSFDCDACGIDIGNGVILSSGTAGVATGPNDSGSDTQGGGNFGANDVDLDILTPFGTNDAAVLEFDFIPQGDSVRFSYVFGSEEYNEYVCGTVNDAFGFFLSGPGISGGLGYTFDAVNLALIPGTDIPVTINTVNLGVSGSNGTPSNCADVSPLWDQNSAFYVDNENNNDPNTTQFDGHTVLLVAEARVDCGATYHIKIVIADGGDTAFDSGVFLEADSFTSNQVIIEGSSSVDSPIFLGDSVLLEGCNLANFQLIRPNSSEEQLITLNIGGTATNGVDYLPEIPTEYVFEVGENTLDIPAFSAIQDNIDEETETIILSYTFLNDCGDEITVESILYIQEYIEPVLNLEDVISPCPDFEVEISAPVVGYAPFSYLWETTEDTFSINVNPNVDTAYNVEVTDVCGVVVSGDVNVTVLQDPDPVIIMDMPDIEVECPGDLTQLLSEVISGAPDYSYLWSTTANTPGTIVNPQTTTVYTVEITDACFQTAIDSITVIVPEADPLAISISIDELPLCPGESFTLSSDATGGFGGYSYAWTPGFGNQSDYTPSPAPVVTTNYNLSVTDACQQNITAQFEVEIPVADPPLTVAAEALNVPGCPGDDVMLTATAEGGFGDNLILQWDGAVVADPNIVVNPTEPTIFTFSATDECGVTETITVEVEVPVNPINIETVSAEAECVGFEVEIFAQGDGGFGELTYLWSNSDTTQTTTVAPDNVNGTTFTITVTDECNVEESADVLVTVENQDPITIDTDAGSAYCLGDDVLAEADADGGLAPYTYVWSNEEVGSDVIVNPSIPGGEDFEVTVTDACGTQATQSVFVEVSDFDPISLLIFADSCAGGFGKIFAFTGGAAPIDIADVYSDPIGVVVNPADSTFNNPVIPGIYDIIVTDACGNTGVHTIVTYLCETLIPNIITPNGDEINDLFIIDNIFLFPGSNLRIWNRWGAMVYESSDYAGETKPFDGKGLSEGTYFYELNRSDGKDFNGTLTLAR